MKSRGRPRYPETLTPRQQEVLDLLRQGLTNEEIGQRLGISADGAKYHVADIMRRLQVDSRYEAAQWEPERARRNWALSLLPLGLFSKMNLKVAAQALGAAVIAGVAIGLGVLAWGVMTSTSGTTISDVPDVNRFVAPVGVPILPSGSSQVLSYDPLTGDIRELSVPVVDPMRLSPGGDEIGFGVGTSVVVSTLDGDQRVFDRQGAGAGATDWSRDGERMLFVGSEGLTSMNLTTGDVTHVIDGNVQDAVWSPDERQVAFVRDQRLAVLDLDSGASNAIAPDLQAMYLPNFYGYGHLAWSPDGEWIAFGNWTAEEPVTQGRSDLYVVHPDGSELRRLTNSPRAKHYLSFSPDSRYLSYLQSGAARGERVGVVDVATGLEVQTGLESFLPLAPQWVSNEAFLASDYEGVWLGQVGSASRLLIPAEGICNRSLVGWGDGRIIFRNVCNAGGL